MKIWLYSTILWLTSLFIGCDNVAVGYLYTNEASYSMDTLQVTRFSALENNIRELKRIFDQYTPEIQDLLAKTDQLETEFVSLQERKDELYEAYKQASAAKEYFSSLRVLGPIEIRMQQKKHRVRLILKSKDDKLLHELVQNYLDETKQIVDVNMHPIMMEE